MRSFVLASLFVGLTGCGLVLDTSPPDPDPIVDDPTVPAPCDSNDDCDDQITCTQDVCLVANDAGATAGCYHVPQDNLCDQPSVANACAKMVCAPRATWDGSGCAVSPTPSICGDDQRCNFETFTCEPMPTSCDVCDDGNPCNGVDVCDTNGGEPTCVRSTDGCVTDGTNACTRAVCDTRSEASKHCIEVVRAAIACLPNMP